MPEGLCPECHVDVLEQQSQNKNKLIATAQAELRELQEENSQVAWFRPCLCLLVPLQSACHHHAAMVQAKDMLPEPSACSTQNLADSEGDYASS